ncbi:MAG: hypothetical protein U9N77_04430 [Thermodesulfobacteriota bacterium]|nr:hypothetical protein [Thermodesulfobacteriota bacterium]
MSLNSYAEFHITAMGSLGGRSLHTTNDESYTPGLPGLSYKKLTIYRKTYPF